MPIDLGKAEARIELADHVVLGGGDVIGDERPRAALPRRLDGDVHRFEFELSAEDTAAHHPILDLERLVVIRRRAQNHRADETIVAQPIERGGIAGQGVGFIHDLRDFLARIPAGGGVELIGLVDELDDASVIDGGEWPIDGRHVEPAEKVVHALGRSEQSLAFGVGGILIALGSRSSAVKATASK